jgi:uncharacterized protein YjiS (DUF1127 family)
MVLSHVIRWLHAWRRYNTTVRQLSLLTDRELADLGLIRSQISSVAYRCALDGVPAAEADADPRIGHADR